MDLPDHIKAKFAADRRIRELVPNAINDIERILLPLTGIERKAVMKALKKRGLL